jgi:hypothetical protein
VITEHTVQVREPLKRHESLGEAGDTIRLAQSAGRVELADRIIEVQGVQPFRPAEEYVLFLRANVSGGFEVIHGKHGAFRIGNGTVETDSRSAVAKTAVTLGSDRFLSALRTLGAR